MAADLNSVSEYCFVNLVAKAQQGDKAALSELVVLVSPLVHYQAKTFSECGIELDDLCQEGMLGVLSAINSFKTDGGASFKTYVSKCVRNRLISVIRCQANNSIPVCDIIPFDNDELVLDTACLVDERLVTKEECENVFGYINSQLSPKERETLRLFLSGLSYEKISLRTGSSPKSVDNALQRVRQKLKKYNS